MDLNDMFTQYEKISQIVAQKKKQCDTIKQKILQMEGSHKHRMNLIRSIDEDLA
jgi:hypothetical protein